MASRIGGTSIRTGLQGFPWERCCSPQQGPRLAGELGCFISVHGGIQYANGRFILFNKLASP